MNGQQKGFSGFVNRTEMVSFSSFVRSIGWLIAVCTFSYAACHLLLSGDDKQMPWGFQVAVAVLGGLGFASSVGAFNTKTVRESAKEFAQVAEAKERGKAQGAAAVTVSHAENVVAPVNGAAAKVGEFHGEHEWAEGDPRAGVL